MGSLITGMAGRGRVTHGFACDVQSSIGRTLEAPIPKKSGLVRNKRLFSKASICPPSFRAPWNCRSIETQARGTHTHTYTHAYIYVRRPKY